MKFNKVIYPKISKLEDFLSNAGKSLIHFRYFDKRPFSIIQNHLVTYLILDDNEFPVCYGHLDKEDETIWLGIAVIENRKGKGYGKKMMNELIKFAKENKIKKIQLSVDNTNKTAINLYHNVGFSIIETTEKTTFMAINLQ